MGQQRTRLNVDERRAQLLELGKTLFSGRTYDELSIDEIARAAGISKGLLYHYFPSKRDFYIETVRAAAEELMALTEPDGDVEPVDRLVVGLDAYLGFVDQNAAAYSTLLRSGIGADAEVSLIVERSRQDFVDRLVTGVGLSTIPAGLRLALRGWIGFVEGASLDWIDHRDLPRETVRDLLVNVLAATIAQVAPEIIPPQGV